MDKVYNANRPFSLGTAGDRRGADTKFLYARLDDLSITWKMVLLKCQLFILANCHF